MPIAAYMLSCPEREAVRQQTLAALQATDWPAPVYVEIDQSTFVRRQERQTQTALDLLQRALAACVDFILFLEDDLEFNQHLWHNLAHWLPLQQAPPGGHFFGSLYNPNVRALERYPEQAYFIAEPRSVYGSQAFILALSTVRYLVAHWDEINGMQDIKMSRLAARVCSIYYHTPSLVQHVGRKSVWGGHYHVAPDFQAAWKSSAHAPTRINIHRPPILRQMRGIEGWLDDAEADLLITATLQALEVAASATDAAIVEVGSYCGKSTVVLGRTLKALGQNAPHVYAIDPHDGKVSGLGQVIMQMAPTLDKFKRALREADLVDIVVPIQARAAEVVWQQPIALLVIDGLHDYASVAADFHHFAAWLQRGGLVAFHDYADYFPGVKQLVNELVSQAGYRLVSQAKSLVVLEKN